MSINNIPYARQSITEDDIKAVTDVLRSDWLTQGPAVEIFEKKIIENTNAKYACAVNSATSALYLAYRALDFGHGDILWTSANTFAATSNAALICGGQVDFIDINGKTYNMDIECLEQKLKIARQIHALPKIVVPVHYAGQPCDIESIRNLSREYGFRIVEDASHAIGAEYKNTKTGDCQFSDITVFSFHPVKIITTGEGGCLTTNNEKLINKIKLLRSHGITSNISEMQKKPSEEIWNYQQIDLGLNYRMADINAALGSSQIDRLEKIIFKRRSLAERYDNKLADLSARITIPFQDPGVHSAFHLYPISVKVKGRPQTQRDVYKFMIENGVRVNLHYIPVYLHPYYQAMGFNSGYCPVAENFYRSALSLPMFYDLTEKEQDYVVSLLGKAVG